MKELLIYYLQIAVPIPFLVVIAKMDYTWSFVVLLFLYILIYRPLIDGHRLVKKGLIERGAQWKMLIPGHRIKYFRGLYFK